VDLVQPTVMFLGYGGNESFAGEDGLKAFIAQYETLLGDLASRTKRLVLLTPLPADGATSPLPRTALDERNRVLSRYSEAIRSLARARGLASIDLFSAMLTEMSRTQQQPLFEQGVHLTESGYLAAAMQIARRTAASPSSLEGFDHRWLAAQANTPAADPRQRNWAALRTLVVTKNELFFHRWRPANVTYLYLFRQREQGNNAVEIPRFDPLIAEKEREIAALRNAIASRSGASRQGRDQ